MTVDVRWAGGSTTLQLDFIVSRLNEGDTRIDNLKWERERERERKQQNLLRKSIGLPRNTDEVNLWSTSQYRFIDQFYSALSSLAPWSDMKFINSLQLSSNSHESCLANWRGPIGYENKIPAYEKCKNRRWKIDPGHFYFGQATIQIGSVFF